MIYRYLLALVLVWVCPHAGAADPRASAAPSAPKTASLLIDVKAKSFFGVPMGIAEDAVFREYGRPAGYIRLNERDALALYARDVALVFRASKLTGLIVSENLLEWDLAKQFRTNSPFDGMRWRLDNGVRYGSSLAEVRQLLGSRLEGDRYNTSYVEGDMRVHIGLARISTDAGDEQSYKVRSVRVEPK